MTHTWELLILTKLFAKDLVANIPENWDNIMMQNQEKIIILNTGFGSSMLEKFSSSLNLDFWKQLLQHSLDQLLDGL